MFSELDFEQMLRDTAGFCDAEWSPDEIEQIVIIIRLELYNRGVACGPKAIRTKMDESCGVKPLPSERTIARMLATNGLTYGRIGWCDGDEKWLPESAIRAKRPAGVCQDMRRGEIGPHGPSCGRVHPGSRQEDAIIGAQSRTTRRTPQSSKPRRGAEGHTALPRRPWIRPRTLRSR